MPYFAPRLLALALCGAALCGCSVMPLVSDAMNSEPKGAPAIKDKPAPQATVQNDVDGNVRQARLLRLAGQYDEAINVLSQLMLVASDNPQVVAEYGKTLAQKGRASDAVQFLGRAIELSPNDWTLYSALGVAYDQTGDQVKARAAYEHALALKPGEAGVLSNYALSRMLAKDPEGAQFLIAKAQASAASDNTADNKQIADNAALIASLLPKPDAAKDAKPTAVAAAGVQKGAPAAKPAPAHADGETSGQAFAQSTGKKAAQAIASNAPLSVPVAAPKPAQPQSQSQPTGAPRALVPAPAAQQPTPPLPPQVAAARSAPLPPYPPTVVMQAVPIDPYAGPVSLHMPKAKSKAVAKADAPNSAPAQGASAKQQAKTVPAPKSDTAKADAQPAVPAKTASTKKDSGIPALRMAADKY